MDKGVGYILEVARCGGITKAAGNLYITPSALSKYVYMKEEELGVPLFHRVGKKFILTEAGEYYVEKCKEIEKIQYQLSLQMKSFSMQLRKEMKIGVQPSFVEITVKKILPEFKKQYPDISISLMEHPIGTLSSMLQKGELDVIISTIDQREKGFEYVKVCDCQLVIATKRENKLQSVVEHREGFRYDWIHLKHCEKEPNVMLVPGTPYRTYAEQLYEYYGLHPWISAEITATKIGLSYIANNEGLMLTMDKMVEYHAEKEKLTFFSVGEWPMQKELAILYCENTLMLEEVTSFIKIALANM